MQQEQKKKAGLLHRKSSNSLNALPTFLPYVSAHLKQPRIQDQRDAWRVHACRSSRNALDASASPVSRQGDRTSTKSRPRNRHRATYGQTGLLGCIGIFLYLIYIFPHFCYFYIEKQPYVQFIMVSSQEIATTTKWCKLHQSFHIGNFNMKHVLNDEKKNNTIRPM